MHPTTITTTACIIIFSIVFQQISSEPVYENSQGSRHEENQLNFEQCLNCLEKSTIKNKQIKRIISNHESKKDIFLSRGWGAGGMPFSVLYMNPTFSSYKAASAPIETKQFRPKNQQKSLPQIRTSIPNNRQLKSNSRVPHSIIPQLFVSYGWGPLGRK